MSTYKSGLSYEKLKEAADADALSTLSKSTYTKNGKSYQARVSYIDRRGDTPKRVFLTHKLDGTTSVGRNATGKRDLENKSLNWGEDVRKDIAKVSGLDADPSKSVRECVAWFIDHKEKRDKDGNMIGVRHSTLMFYRACAKRLEKVPRIVSMPLNELTKNDVQSLVDAMSAHYSKKSVKDTLNILDATCRRFLKRSDNPCDGVVIPPNTKQGKRGKGKSNKPNSLTRDGLARLNRLLDERESKYDGLDCLTIGARIAIHTGMRAEEVCGLRWNDVDFINHKVYVVNVIERADVAVVNDDGVKVYNEDGTLKTEYREFDSSPKTEGSIRRIKLDSELESVLKLHRASMVALLEQQYPKAKERPQIETLYVIGGIDGSHYSPHRLGVNFKKFCRVRGIMGTEGETVGFHDLRHTYATLSLKEHPEKLSEISATLGHSKVTTTLNMYVGRDEDEQDEFISSMESVFSARTPDDVLMLKNGTDN